MTPKQRFISFFMGCLLIAGGAGLAMGEDEPMKDLSNFSCKDIMRLSGGERDAAIAVLHGFLLGKKGVTRFDDQKLGEATDNFLEHCLDHPNDKALTVMEQKTN